MHQTLLLIFVLFCVSCQPNRQESISFPKGGYPYKALKAGAANFYQYPLNEVMTKSDSMRTAFYGPQFYPAFDEPNLSLRPPQRPIIRFIYESGYVGYAAILTLTEGKMVVKEQVAGLPASYPEETNLVDTLERYNLRLLDRHYPLSEYNGSSIRKKYYDSLAKVFPQLNDPHYYLSLMNKAKMQQAKSFTYRTWIVSLSHKKYKQLLDSINHSEFWQLPFQDNRCAGESTDADGYSLEVATPVQYQMVFSTPCIKPTKFERACQRLMEVSGLQSSFKKYCDEAIQKARATNQ